MTHDTPDQYRRRALALLAAHRELFDGSAQRRAFRDDPGPAIRIRREAAAAAHRGRQLALPIARRMRG